MKEHGTYSIHLKEQLLIAKVTGSHNEFDVRTVTNQLRKHIESFKGAPFGEIIDARTLDGVTPEGFLVIEEYSQWAIQNGLVARAFVASNTVLPMIIKQQLHSAKEMNMQYFSDIEEARQWLLETLLKHSEYN